MKNAPRIAALASLMGDPARANMLTALMSGQALTAGELARIAGVLPATASSHLSQLLAGGLMVVERQGRHRYYRLSSPEVASAIEALMALSDQSSRRSVQTGPKAPEMRLARVCYDHLAGERAVALFVRMTEQKLLMLDHGSIAMTTTGEQQFRDFGINVTALKTETRPVCRTCLDWSERRSHLAGSLGAALLNRLFALRWATRVDGTRVVRFSRAGDAGFAKLFQ